MKVAPAAAALFAILSASVALAAEKADEGFQGYEEKRTNAYAAQLESFLRKLLVDQYPERAAKAWNRDYSSIAAFLKSVEPNRRRWRQVIKPPELLKTGAATRTPHAPLAEWLSHAITLEPSRPGATGKDAGGVVQDPPRESIRAEWVRVPLGDLAAEGILVVPAAATAENRVPLVIVQHGIGSFPERNFGLMDQGDAYHSYARVLVENGFAVLTPLNLRSVERRNRIERLCRLADLSLPGIELARMQRLLDEALDDPRVDGQRVGMWGLSLGGLATMFWTPLEPRIKVGVVAGWFNHRRNKMVIPDPRYSCFLETKEEHAFFDGWLIESSDSDVASLICPRPLLIQTGKKDGIAHWPMVVEEFEAARQHYRKLGVPERIEMDLQEGGHEAHVQSGLRFLTRWLKEQPLEH